MSLFFFAIFVDFDFFLVHIKQSKKELRQFPAILTLRLLGGAFA